MQNIREKSGSRARCFKLLRRAGIDSTSLCSLAGRYDNPIPNRFLAPIDCSNIPAQVNGEGSRVTQAKSNRDLEKIRGRERVRKVAETEMSVKRLSQKYR